MSYSFFLYLLGIYVLLSYIVLVIFSLSIVSIIYLFMKFRETGDNLGGFKLPFIIFIVSLFIITVSPSKQVLELVFQENQLEKLICEKETSDNNK